MNKFIYIFFILTSLFVTSCANTTNQKETPKMGAKDGVCYSTLTCNSGLICIDMICKDDPCYNVKCDKWKICNEGICKLKANKCDRKEDCNDDMATCDIEHNCIYEVDLCKDVDCSNHGKCLVDTTSQNAVCTCFAGYNNNDNPLECQEDEVVDLCLNNNCKNWETCNSQTGNCELIPGRCGTDRDCIGDKICNDNNCLDPVNPCEGITCSNHGTCVINPETELVTCNCNTTAGYFPDSTGLNCINPCSGHENCDGYGECKSTSSVDATCTCIAGYKPQGLKCIEDNKCEGSTCAEWKPCNPIDGSCVLSNGRCDSDNDCITGQVCDDNHSCITPNDPCEGQLCSGHGTCFVNNDGNAQCNCDITNHYYPSGLNCLNPCDGETCSGNGSCIPSSATDAVCHCNEGFHDLGLTCVENDPCENITCDNSWEECRNGSCELKDGMCSIPADCPTDKPACENNTCVNLCDNLNCGANGQCTSDSTEAICVCNDGYSGDLCNSCSEGYQDNDNNGTCEPYVVWCKLQSPLTINQDKDTQGELVFARIYVEGVTETTTDSSPIIKAQLGYTPYEMTSPVVEGNFFFIEASYNPSCSTCEANNDEYMVSFPTDMAGDYKYIYRVSVDDGNSWLYCDLNGSGGANNDPFEADQVGTATINGAVENPITELFISEYIEGASGNNKAIEIYNGSDNAIDLSNYELWKISNGGNWADNKLTLSGTLNPGDVYVVCHRDENLFPDVCDLKEFTISAFNGNDAIGLVKNGNLIDSVGTEGGISTDGWEVAGIENATKDHVLRRKHTIMQGNTNWDTSRGTNETDSEWIILTDDFSNLGSFTSSE